MRLKPHRNLMQFLAEGAGYCCVKELLRSNQKIKTVRLAAKLGVDPSLLSYYKRRNRLGYIHCCPNCPEKKADCRPLLPSFEDDNG